MIVIAGRVGDSAGVLGARHIVQAGEGGVHRIESWPFFSRGKISQSRARLGVLRRDGSALATLRCLLLFFPTLSTFLPALLLQ